MTRPSVHGDAAIDALRRGEYEEAARHYEAAARACIGHGSRRAYLGLADKARTWITKMATVERLLAGSVSR